MHKFFEVGLKYYMDASIVRHTPLSDEFIKEDYKDLSKYSHLFVLGCIMDKQIKAEVSWRIPYQVCSFLGTFEMCNLVKFPRETIQNCFLQNNFHRFTNKLGNEFYEAIQNIHNNYQDDASLILKDRPSSAMVVFRLLQFKGIGVKIATMATNILVREYRI